MIDITQAQWHMISAADEVITLGGYIIGVIENGKTIMFDR